MTHYSEFKERLTHKGSLYILRIRQYELIRNEEHLIRFMKEGYKIKYIMPTQDGADIVFEYIEQQLLCKNCNHNLYASSYKLVDNVNNTSKDCTDYFHLCDGVITTNCICGCKTHELVKNNMDLKTACGILFPLLLNITDKDSITGEERKFVDATLNLINKIYPEDIYDGSSNDSGPNAIVKIRNLLKTLKS